MLFLKRIRCFNEFLVCDASGEVMMYGDFYYEDDQTGKIISANYYKNLKEQRKRDTFDYTILNNAQSQKEYQDQLKKAEQEYLTATILDEPVFGKDSQNNEREANK